MPMIGRDQKINSLQKREFSVMNIIKIRFPNKMEYSVLIGSLILYIKK